MTTATATLKKTSEQERVTTALANLKELCTKLPQGNLGHVSKMIALLSIHDVMQGMFSDFNEDPYPKIAYVLEVQQHFLESISTLDSWVDMNRVQTHEHSTADAVQKLTELYEQAWTVYSRDTFDHSVQLIIDRLKANGFDEEFFAGKTCYDGGCGTGRFAIAMAKLGAARSVGADIGKESLDFAQDMAKQIDVPNVKFVFEDITDLSNWDDETFDVVVSNGVLHHTIEQERGIQEHFRVLKKGGVFWLYLYGAGGVYWEVYDAFKIMTSDMTAKEMRQIMLDLNIREGGIYSFLDMLAQIREYYTPADIERILEGCGEFTMTNMKGTCPEDDTDMLLSTKYGTDILGPHGEIRLRIDKH